MLQPVVRRTWGPRGQTPIHKSWDRRDRLSAVSAVTVSSPRRRLGLYFDIHDHNIVTEDFVCFVAQLLRSLQRPIILVLDRWQVHRSAARRLVGRFPRRVHIEWLPPYAPELNPDEQVWTRTKYVDLANFIPEDVHDLRRAIRYSIRRTRGQQQLLRGFFRHAKLKV